ncbi:MAG: ATP-binding protein, partial [Bdellovibrio sp.]
MSSYMRSFSAVLVLGARQVGKTTLIRKALAKTHAYVLLEDPDVRELAINDPRSFFKKFPPPLIIDEFQYAPQLISYLQGLIDENRDMRGQFVLTGSQNFQMMEQVTQSLAGRIGVLTLYGLSSQEINKEKIFDSASISQCILRGTYPELWGQPQIKTREWMSSYVQTFLERDLRQLGQVGDLVAFERFLKVSAARTAQVLNISDMAQDCGISPPTAQKWLSILERAYVIRLVQPYFTNLTSRVRKASKLYFLDTGLACYLMGYRDAEVLQQSPHIGPLFETLV